MNTIRKRRLFWIILLIASSLLAAFLILKALKKNVNLFFTPTQVMMGEAKMGRTVRIGGMVQKGSFVQEEGLKIRFVITDFSNFVVVKYTGILPDLFKEGQGVVVLGRLAQDQNNIFYADQVLAKHDENYTPPEIKHILRNKK
jgi:cytochrome c-type biogenesis protein CcmE